MGRCSASRLRARWGRLLGAAAAALSLLACNRLPVNHPSASSLPPPVPAGPAVATVEVAVPAGHAGRVICAGLKHDGLVLARGQATAPAGGSVRVELRAMTAATQVP